MMLPVLAGYIAMSIADRPGLAAGFVGGLVAKMGMTFGNPAGGDVNAGFLGALFAGFAAGYILVGLRKLLSKLPKSLEGIKPVLLYPVLGVFITAVVTTFINPYVGMINDALTNALNSMGGTSRVILGMVVAGMMSVDMGGPVNKAAYVFGTAQLQRGILRFMELSWQEEWFRRWSLPCAPLSLKRNLPKKIASLAWSTISWDCPLLQKASFHLQLRIPYVSFHPA